MKKVLILDDSEIVRSIVAMVLSSHGYDVVGIEAPPELGAAIERESPDLVLVDLTFPNIRTESVVAIVRARVKKDCPIVLYSDRPEVELATKAATCGAAGYIKKGGDPALLVRHVARLVGAGA